MLETTPPPAERGFGRDGPALGKAKEMDSWSRPPAIVHEVIEHLGDVIDRRGWIGVCDKIAERVEGRVPLKRVLVQIWNPLCCSVKGQGVVSIIESPIGSYGRTAPVHAEPAWPSGEA